MARNEDSSAKGLRILWCHEVDYRDKPVYEYQDFAERLSGRGHSVEVIDFNESCPRSPERVSRTGEGTVTVSPVPHSNLPILKYAEGRLRFRQMLKKRLDAGTVDVAVVYSVFINGTQTLELCRQRGVPVVCRVLDAYHRLRNGRMSQALLRSGERYLYRHADRVLVTNERMARYVSEIAGRDVGSRTAVLDHGVDTGHFRPSPRDPALAARFGLEPDARVALFLGTTYSFSGLERLIDRLPAIVARMPDFRLVVVGAGELDDALRAAVQRTGMHGRVHLTGMIAYPDLPAYLSLATLAINPFEINDITRDIVPIKLLQYLASGLPVLSTPLPDVTRKFPEGESGIRYSNSDRSEDFVDTMIELLQDRQALRSQATAGLGFVSRNYSVDAAIAQLECEFRRLQEQRS